MNARQKAKHYKKLYEQTRYNTIQPEFKMFNGSRVKLKCRKSVPREVFPVVTASGVVVNAEIKRELAYRLAEGLTEYMTVDVEQSSNPYLIDFVGSVEVVKWNE